MAAKPLQLFADHAVVSTAKIMCTAKISGQGLQIVGGGSHTTCAIPVPELQLPGGQKVRHTNAIMRRIAQISDSTLMGNSFIEEGLVDSWLEWISLEVDHLLLETEEALTEVCGTLEGHLKTRTFLVGQRMTLADVSLALSLQKPMEKLGHDKFRGAFPSTLRWLLTCVHQMPAVEQPSKEPASATKAIAPPTSTKETDTKATAAACAAEPDTKKVAAQAPVSEEAVASNSKKEEKKKAKEEEKRKKEEEKKKKEEERLAAQEAKFKGPTITMAEMDKVNFGNLFIQSEMKTDRVWTTVRALTPEIEGKYVWVRARAQTTRKQGNKLCFLELRQDLATVQAVAFGPEIAGFAGNLPDESVVDVYAKVAIPQEKIKACTQLDVELAVEKVFCIGRAASLPLALKDAARNEAECDADPSLVRVGQDVRLDNRVIDLRTVAHQGIFRIQSGVCALFREFLSQNGFQEIHTPKLIGGASEGGADVFRVDYFGGNAFLAQSPQLYKQMALMTDMPRVFEIGPIFRSEKSFTHRHMTEFTGLDLEMTFKDHYHEVLEILDGLFNHIFEGLNKRYSVEIDAIRQQYGFEDLKWKYPCLRLTFKEAIQLLRKRGPGILEQRLGAAKSDYEKGIISAHLQSVKGHDDEDDISTEDEKLLGVIIREDYGEELYIIDKFPKDVRPFYTMADPTDPKWTNAYDVFLRGEEITSGAQRIHDPKMLADKAQSMGIDVSTIQPYVDAFKYGSYPHAGAGIGMERVVMLFLNLPNIRKTSMFPRDPKRLTP